MSTVRVLVLRTAGTNCDEETAHAFQLAGARPETMHVAAVLAGASRLDDFDILAFPGGFSYGDDLGAGTVLANQLRSRLAGELADFVAAGKLVLGICNGFQVLVRLGILPGSRAIGADASSQEPEQESRATIGTKSASLIENDSAKFEDRWVRLEVAASRSPFLAFAADTADRSLRMPVAHREGRFVVRDDATLGRLRDGGQIALRYARHAGDGVASGAYPDNPNGSVDDIAGVTNERGNVLGLMPHPERFVSAFHDPLWTRDSRIREIDDAERLARSGDGFRLFASAVAHVEERGPGR